MEEVVHRISKFFKAIRDRKDILLLSFNEYLAESALHGVKYFVGQHTIIKILWVHAYE